MARHGTRQRATGNGHTADGGPASARLTSLQRETNSGMKRFSAWLWRIVILAVLAFVPASSLWRTFEGHSFLKLYVMSVFAWIVVILVGAVFIQEGIASSGQLILPKHRRDRRDEPS